LPSSNSSPASTIINDKFDVGRRFDKVGEWIEAKKINKYSRAVIQGNLLETK
jgi:hypothetical protein